MNATPAQIRLAEGVYRCEAHCLVSCELYGAGRAEDALLQSARPMTDVFPWLETELRSSETELRAFMGAVTRVGALIRRSPRPRLLRSSLKEVRETRVGLIRVIFGAEADSGRLNALIALPLLDTLRDSYALAVEAEDLSGYQTSYALTQISSQLLDVAARDASVDLPSVESLRAAFPSAVPPSKLVRPEQLSGAIQAIFSEVEQRLGITASSVTLRDQLDEVGRLLGDVLASYDRGHAPVAARLAASLFVRSYDPIRKDLSRFSPSSEQTLTRLLGVELRRAINDQVHPDEIARIGAKIRVQLEAAERDSDPAPMAT